MKKNKQLFFALIAAMLSACGGGGGGATVASGPSSFSASCAGGTIQTSSISLADATGKCPAVGIATLALAVPVSTYPAGSEELAAFNLLNAERGRCGFGLLAQNTQLDATAKAHADYQIVNNYLGHFENQQLLPLGFTGVDALARAAVQGYAGSLVGDYISPMPSNVQPGYGLLGIRSLLSAPYHLSGLLQGYNDVGFAARNNTQTNPARTYPFTLLQVNMGVKATDKRQLVAALDTLTYPCDGSTNVKLALFGEEPNPIPGRDLGVSPLGTPLYVMGRFGNTLTIASASLKETATNTAVVLRTPILAGTDPNNLFSSHEGYVAPDGPLKPMTGYTANITGANNGTAFSKTFSFTTGN